MPVFTNEFDDTLLKDEDHKIKLLNEKEENFNMISSNNNIKNKVKKKINYLYIPTKSGELTATINVMVHEKHEQFDKNDYTIENTAQSQNIKTNKAYFSILNKIYEKKVRTLSLDKVNIDQSHEKSELLPLININKGKGLVHSGTFTKTNPYLKNLTIKKEEQKTLKKDIIDRSVMIISTTTFERSDRSVDTSELDQYISKKVIKATEEPKAEPIFTEEKEISNKIKSEDEHLENLLGSGDTDLKPNVDTTKLDFVQEMLKSLLKELNLQRSEIHSHLYEKSKEAKNITKDNVELLTPNSEILPTSKPGTEKQDFFDVNKNATEVEGNAYSSNILGVANRTILNSTNRKSMPTCKALLLPYVRVFKVDFFDELIKSHISSSDRRIQAISKKVNCMIEIVGPLKSCRKNKIFYHCYLTSDVKIFVDKCLKYLYYCFQSTRLHEISVPGSAFKF